MKNAAHLNGKIGDARSYNSDTGRYEIHFEDKSLNPARVKRENLRIVLELPPPEAEYVDRADKEAAAASADTRAEEDADEARAEEAAAALLSELDLEGGKSNTSNQPKGKKKGGKKNRRK